MFDQAHAKRVAAENKRSRRFALGGGFGGGRSKAARPKVGNSRGKVVKAFAADSDEEEESEEVRQAYCCYSSVCDGGLQGLSPWGIKRLTHFYILN